MATVTRTSEPDGEPRRGESLAGEPLDGQPGRDEPRPEERRHRHARWHAFLANRLAVAAAVFLILVISAAVLAPLLARHDPTATELLNKFARPTGDHPLGTDGLGRDVLSRLLYATRVSMLASMLSVGAALVIALPLGMVAGYFGRAIDRIVAFFVDVILSVPPLILVFAIAGVLGPSLRNAIIALAVYFTPMYIRLIRTETLRIRHSQMSEAEIALGVPDRRVIVRHVLPNLAPSLVVQVALTLGTALLAEASLSFLGIGVRPPDSSWGLMLRQAYDTITTHPWQLLAPATIIALTVVSWNLLADGLRDAFGKVEGS